MLAASHPLPSQRRRQAPGRRRRGSVEVGREGPVLQRGFARAAAVAVAGAGEMEGVEVVALPLAAGPGLSVRRDGDHDQVRVHLLEERRSQPEVPHLRRRVVLDQHVGPGEQPQQHVAPGAGAHVQGDAALVGVQEVEQAALLRVGLVAGEGAPAPGDVTALRRLDLDDLGTVVGEQLGAVGRRDHLAQLDDRDSFQSTVGQAASSRFDGFVPAGPWGPLSAAARPLYSARGFPPTPSRPGSQRCGSSAPKGEFPDRFFLGSGGGAADAPCRRAWR